MSHESSGTGNHSPTDFQKTLASLVASLIIAVGQIFYSIFRFAFSIISSLA